MRAIGESAFDIIYLITVITLGILMIKNNRKAGNRKNECLLFGIMAVVLGSGDAFHLIPRAYALCTTGLENFPKALGIGKMITSVTMTIFYVLLYYVWKKRYAVSKRWLSLTIWALAVCRIVLCFMPQNQWTSASASYSWGIYRNIPFTLLGIAIIILFAIFPVNKEDKAFKYLWVAVTLSFGFYIPVVLHASKIPMLGMLMIPKTCAYIWIVVIGYKAYLSKKS